MKARRLSNRDLLTNVGKHTSINACTYTHIHRYVQSHTYAHAYKRTYTYKHTATIQIHSFTCSPFPQKNSKKRIQLGSYGL